MPGTFRTPDTTSEQIVAIKLQFKEKQTGTHMICLSVKSCKNDQEFI